MKRLEPASKPFSTRLTPSLTTRAVPTEFGKAEGQLSCQPATSFSLSTYSSWSQAFSCSTGVSKCSSTTDCRSLSEHSAPWYVSRPFSSKEIFTTFSSFYSNKFLTALVSILVTSFSMPLVLSYFSSSYGCQSSAVSSPTI